MRDLVRTGEVINVVTSGGSAVPWRQRLAIAMILGLLAGCYTKATYEGLATPRDFIQVWHAARAMLAGDEPYRSVGPGRAYYFPYTLQYPLPAAVIVAPLAWLRSDVASVVFSALAGGVFAWALMQHGYAPLIGFFSAASMKAFYLVQWSPLFAAATVLAPIGLLLVAKPTLGAAVFAARPSWWPVIGAALFAGIAFAIEPMWVRNWLGAVAENRRHYAPAAPYRALIQIPGGLVALLCLIRWRRPEARLVAALACVPQNFSFYESLPLFLATRRWWEALVLTLSSWAALVWVADHLPVIPNPGVALDLMGRTVAIALYLPVTLMVLRRANDPVSEP
jgi:hypothetical protein